MEYKYSDDCVECGGNYRHNREVAGDFVCSSCRSANENRKAENENRKAEKRFRILIFPAVILPPVCAVIVAYFAEALNHGPISLLERVASSLLALPLISGFTIVVFLWARSEGWVRVPPEFLASILSLVSRNRPRRFDGDAPRITVGMSKITVDGLLGMPVSIKSGREIAASLGRDTIESTKSFSSHEYGLYEHPAGAYQIVFSEGSVVEINSQPS